MILLVQIVERNENFSELKKDLSREVATEMASLSDESFSQLLTVLEVNRKELCDLTRDDITEAEKLGNIVRLTPRSSLSGTSSTASSPQRISDLSLSKGTKIPFTDGVGIKNILQLKKRLVDKSLFIKEFLEMLSCICADLTTTKMGEIHQSGYVVRVFRHSG
jgi:DNA-directed RNA polymerase subunit H (RpoH/RPB5)